MMASDESKLTKVFIPILSLIVTFLAISSKDTVLAKMFSFFKDEHIEVDSIQKANLLHQTHAKKSSDSLLPNYSQNYVPIQPDYSIDEEQSIDKIELDSYQNLSKKYPLSYPIKLKEEENLSELFQKSHMSNQEVRDYNLHLNPHIYNDTVFFRKDIFYDSTYIFLKARGFYSVKKGDTFYDIAHRAGVTISELRRVNRIKNSNMEVHQRLLIPYPNINQ